MPEDLLTEEINVEKAPQRTFTWANAMLQWLSEYESHIEQLCREKKIPRPPQW